MVNQIETDELRRMMQTGEPPQVLNVLPREQFEKQHIPGSQHADQSEDGFLRQVEDLVGGDKTETVVVYCADEDCDASPKAAEKLESAGFENVHDYEGGMKAWREAGYEVETGAATS